MLQSTGKMLKKECHLRAKDLFTQHQLATEQRVADSLQTARGRGVLRTSTRPTINIFLLLLLPLLLILLIVFSLLLLSLLLPLITLLLPLLPHPRLLRAYVLAFTPKVSHAPIPVECLFSTTLARGVLERTAGNLEQARDIQTEWAAAAAAHEVRH